MSALDKLKKNGINLTYEDVVDICQKYGLKELSVFGSSIRDDFTEDSDVDFLISYFKDLKVSLIDLVRLKFELSDLLSREVDVVEREGLINPIRKKIIFSTAEVLYAYQ